MAHTSFTVEDEVLNKLDHIILEKKSSGDLPMGASRSEVISELVEEYVDENEHLINNNNGDGNPAQAD